LLTQAAGEAQKLGKLPSVALPEITIERPQNPEHGDYASSFPLKLARTIGVNPLTIANDMVGLIAPGYEIDSPVMRLIVLPQHHRGLSTSGLKVIG